MCSIVAAHHPRRGDGQPGERALDDEVAADLVHAEPTAALGGGDLGERGAAGAHEEGRSRSREGSGARGARGGGA